MARTVLIVDDHAPFRARARALLEAEGFEVVGDVADGESAMVAAHALQPDVVLLDIQLPDADGFAVAERLVTQADPPSVVLISSRSAESYRHQLVSSSARGFIAKAELSGECLGLLLD